MKLRNTLFFSLALLIAIPQGLLAMEQVNVHEEEVIDLKFKEDKPAGEQGWFRKKWNGLSTTEQVAAGVGAGALSVGAVAAASPSVRTTLKSWCIDPFVNKYKAVQQNGFVKEMVTKPMLGTYALAGSLGYGLYKWRSLSEEDRKKKLEDTKAWVSENKGKVLLGAGVIAVAAYMYKNATTAQQSPSKEEREDLLKAINPELVKWFTKTWEGLSEAQRFTIFNTWVKPEVLWTLLSKEQQAELQKDNKKPSDIPYDVLLGSLNQEQAEALLNGVIGAALFAPNDLIMNTEHKPFIACLTQAQKAELLEFIKEHNKTLFEAEKKHFAQVFSVDEVLSAKLLTAQNPQELLALVESPEAAEALKKATVISADAPAVVQALKVHFKLIIAAYAAQNAYAQNQQQGPVSKLDELVAIYRAEADVFAESISNVQKEALQKLGIATIVDVLRNPLLVNNNPTAKAVLTPAQLPTFEGLVRLFNEIQVVAAARK